MSISAVVAIFMCTRLHPQTDITHKPASNSYFHTLFDVKLGLHLTINLFKVEAIFST